MADDPRKAEHEARVKALNEANAQSAAAQGHPPTPTQEENDLLSLGLMHPDEKKPSGEPEGEPMRRGGPERRPPAEREAERRPAPEPARRTP